MSITSTIVRRARKAWSDPRAALVTLEYGPVNSAHWRIRKWLSPIAGRWGKSCLKQHGALPFVDAYNAKRPPSAFEPDWYDLWHLYRDIIGFRPRQLLEYGSGQSTVVMAAALAKNAADGSQPGHLTSLESEAQWAEINHQAIPAELRQFVTVMHSPRRILSELEIRFSHAPVAAPDFVYLDGPDHPWHRMASLDLLDLEPNFPRNFALVVDGRTFNKNELLKRFKRKYRSRRRGLASNDTVITPALPFFRKSRSRN
jgi:hypothetical protein